MSRLLELVLTDIHGRKWQTINSSFMLVDSGESADDFQKKKIDFAIFLNPTSKNSDVEALYALYNALQQDIGEAFRGLWTDTFTSTLIPFLLIEVEPDDQKEAEVKLMTAASAFLNYLLHLLEEKASRSAMDPKFKTSLQQRLPPAFSWLVQGHKWKFYICYRIHDGHFVGRFVSLFLGLSIHHCPRLWYLTTLPGVGSVFQGRWKHTLWMGSCPPPSDHRSGQGGCWRAVSGVADGIVWSQTSEDGLNVR